MARIHTHSKRLMQFSIRVITPHQWHYEHIPLQQWSQFSLSVDFVGICIIWPLIRNQFNLFTLKWTTLWSALNFIFKNENNTGLLKTSSALQMSNDELNSKLFTRFTLLCTSQISYLCSVMFNLLHHLHNSLHAVQMIHDYSTRIIHWMYKFLF